MMLFRTAAAAQRATASPVASDGIRRSYALESLTNALRTQEGLQILDLGGINQSNLDFVTGLGHRLYSEDLVRAAEGFFTPEELDGTDLRPDRIERFLDETFEFPDQSCDGALVWDSLQFLTMDLAVAVLDRLYRVLAPDALLLAFFHKDASGAVASPHSCRIIDHSHLQLTSRPAKRKIQPFSTRAIERFFQRFSSVKFFLSRENIQEVLSRR